MNPEHEEALYVARDRVQRWCPEAADFEPVEMIDGELIGFTFAIPSEDSTRYGQIALDGAPWMGKYPTRTMAEASLDLAHGEAANIAAQDAAREPRTDVDGIRDRIASIKFLGSKHDDEAAHGAEDKLYLDVLQAIADGAGNPAELAREALKASEVSFLRGCL